MGDTVPALTGTMADADRQGQGCVADARIPELSGWVAGGTTCLQGGRGRRALGPLKPSADISGPGCLALALSYILPKHASSRKPAETTVLGKLLRPLYSHHGTSICHLYRVCFWGKGPTPPGMASVSVPQRCQHLGVPTYYRDAALYDALVWGVLRVQHSG